MSEQVMDQEPNATGEHSAQPADPFAPVQPQLGEPTLGQPQKRRRTSRVDTVLAQAQDVASAGVEEIAPKNSIGLLHHLRGEEERLTTHLFECTLTGYRGWFWYATLARAPRSKTATVCEVGLLPGDDALLAPEWVPWEQRMASHQGEYEGKDAPRLDTEGADAQNPRESRAQRSKAKRRGKKALNAKRRAAGSQRAKSKASN